MRPLSPVSPRVIAIPKSSRASKEEPLAQQDRLRENGVQFLSKAFLRKLRSAPSPS